MSSDRDRERAPKVFASRPGQWQGDSFETEVDRRDFVRTLAEACLRTGWQIHTFCLLGNHFHLVVGTPSVSLSAGMHWFLSAYTIRLNHRNKFSGHVFGGNPVVAFHRGLPCDIVLLNRLWPPAPQLQTAIRQLAKEKHVIPSSKIKTNHFTSTDGAARTWAWLSGQKRGLLAGPEFA
jgi:hypothetical protein